MHRQKLILSAAIIFLLLALTACGEGSLTGGSNGGLEDQPNGAIPEGEEANGDESPNEAGTDTEDPKSEGDVIYEHELILSIFHVDMEVTHLQALQTRINYNEQAELLQHIWLELQQVEEEQADIWGQVELNDIKLQEGLLTIDIQEPEPGSLNLGSAGEALGLQALIFTFSQVPDVQHIQLTIDGEVRETLAGHVSIDQPFELNEEIIKLD